MKPLKEVTFVVPHRYLNRFDHRWATGENGLKVHYLEGKNCDSIRIERENYGTVLVPIDRVQFFVPAEVEQFEPKPMGRPRKATVE